ncbi:hypothetical protein EN829_015120 [Mesorhizobium sp. M00.F.Ca.ET.186.01.1.1]|nr:hypothetical protein EN848_14315 [bacterium M00.F.Ca.ET.205.01.1.1]TGU53011.1 hypothetical protein EN795_15075 [bacterium M00.F.Ca.ET.152.01.1.1]TGV35981.1 hypothetical protein EN829_015120 [Mesorhizobium sp. M00.F.Ca.ET.186.01.1.1]TGZ43564.1 hypothetical protein EN805_10690 [bacterium M00.F.Ca.ET.162.01.1.1]
MAGRLRHGLYVPRSSWAIRRRIVIITLTWCGGMVTYLSIWGRPVTLSETAVNGCLLLMASVIGSYVFGAVWDDKNRPADPYQYPPPPSGLAMPPPPEEQP